MFKTEETFKSRARRNLFSFIRKLKGFPRIKGLLFLALQNELIVGIVRKNYFSGEHYRAFYLNELLFIEHQSNLLLGNSGGELWGRF